MDRTLQKCIALGLLFVGLIYAYALFVDFQSGMISMVAFFTALILTVWYGTMFGKIK